MGWDPLRVLSVRDEGLGLFVMVEGLELVECFEAVVMDGWMDGWKGERSARRLCVGLTGQGFEVYAFLGGVCIMGGEIYA